MARKDSASLAALWFSRRSLTEIDRRAAADFGLSIAALMENAGRALAEITRAYTHADSRVLVLAGPGNNGGDGLVAARWLANFGQPVRILLLAAPEKFTGPAAEQLNTVQRMSLTIQHLDTANPAADILASWIDNSNVDDAIVDAIFGTGLTRSVTDGVAAAIQKVNESNRRVISADIPSGLDCDTGEPLGIAVRATHTISFCGMKIGFSRPGAIGYAGQCSIGDIGVPRCLLEELAVEP